jgi:hypothetical protein
MAWTAARRLQLPESLSFDEWVAVGRQLHATGELCRQAGLTRCARWQTVSKLVGFADAASCCGRSRRTLGRPAKETQEGAHASFQDELPIAGRHCARPLRLMSGLLHDRFARTMSPISGHDYRVVIQLCDSVFKEVQNHGGYLLQLSGLGTQLVSRSLAVEPHDKPSDHGARKAPRPRG